MSIIRKRIKKLLGLTPKSNSSHRNQRPKHDATRRVESPTPPTNAPTPSPETEQDLELSTKELGLWIERGDKVAYLDIREPHELLSGIIPSSLTIPMNSIPASLGQLPNDLPLVVYCAAGVRSYSVTHWLRANGYPNAWSLSQGVYAWVTLGHELSHEG